MKIQNRVFFLDFDGVLCNSLNESLIVSYNTYHKTSIKDLNQIPKQSREYFYNNRWIVRPAGEYYVLWKAYDMSINIDKKIFKKLKNENNSHIISFQKDFYLFREKLKKDLSYWLSLHETYHNVKEFLTTTEDELFIVTNKDKKSVELLSKYFKYDKKILSIYSMEISFDKKVLIKMAINDNNIDILNSELIFIDDNVSNLNNIDKMDENINTYLATWGYLDNTGLNFNNRLINMDLFIGKP